ncbi:hypothetical protein KJ855_02020 [Patescibacteria group bacterium]|nr:hypothetical protein [Patescibacteria group bacterium]
MAKMKADGEWGEHFPMMTALFTYYDSYSYPPWPIEEEQISYIDRENGLAEVDLGGEGKTILHWRPVLEFVRDEASGYELADDVRDYVGEDKQKELLNAVLVCDKTSRKYRIQSRELYFYLKHNIAIPRESFHARHTRRMKQLMRCDVHSYNCDKCGKEVQTVYNKSVDGREVWCGECYQGVIM